MIISSPRSSNLDVQCTVRIVSDQRSVHTGRAADSRQRKMGRKCTFDFEPGVVHVDVPLSPSFNTFVGFRLNNRHSAGAEVVPPVG